LILDAVWVLNLSRPDPELPGTTQPTVLAADHIQVLAEGLVLQLLQFLGPAQDRNRVGREGQAVAAADVARMQPREEGDGAQATLPFPLPRAAHRR